MTPLDEVPLRIRIRGHGDKAHQIEAVLTGWSASGPVIGYHTACGIGGPPGRFRSGVGYPRCETCWPDHAVEGGAE